MSEHLEKARAALAAASELEHTDTLYLELLHIANVQAQIAAAVALERIADAIGVAALRT